MRYGTWLIVALLMASGGCAGGGWLGRGVEQEQEQPSTVREMLSRKDQAQPSANSSPKIKPSPPIEHRRAEIAQVSHTTPVPDKKSKKNEEDGEKGGFVKRFAQARSLESANKLDEARTIYQQLISDYPKRWEPYHRLGLVADRQKRFTEAESLLSEALRRKPMDAELFADLGYCYYLQGKLDKAESALTKAVAIKPSEARYRNNLGLVYGVKGRTEEALESFRHAGSEADAQYNMAFVMATRNDMAGAKKRFQMALDVEPNHEEARRALRSFEQADRDGEQALEPELTADGRRWVPYIEDSTQAASQGVNSTASRALQSKARGMVQTRLAEKAGR